LFIAGLKFILSKTKNNSVEQGFCRKVSTKRQPCILHAGIIFWGIFKIEKAPKETFLKTLSNEGLLFL